MFGYHSLAVTSPVEYVDKHSGVSVCNTDLQTESDSRDPAPQSGIEANHEADGLAQLTLRRTAGS